MSASARLKALESFHLTVESIGDVTLYQLPLPQIVAVIDVAERIATTDDSVWGTKDGLGFKLQDRLADLEEVLGA